MVATKASPSAEIRARLDHPVVDVDGHMVELLPVVMEYMRREGGKALEELVAPLMDVTRWAQTPAEERRRCWSPIRNWWGYPATITLDRATSYLPKLLHSRLDEIGIDFTVLYPSFGLGLPSIPDADTRRAACRAYNTYLADTYRDYSDRITPAAMLPMHTPQEAIAELEHVVRDLRLKVIVIGTVRRPIPKSDWERAGVTERIDVLGIDSPYDYDPFWARCADLRVAPTSHTVAIGWGARRSPDNYMVNHIGHFGDAGEALCKALFFGGVTRRFPALNFAFLEGGAGWACNLYADIMARWAKRNGTAIHRLDPDRLDRDELMRTIAEYGDQRVKSKLDDIRSFVHRPEPRPAELDDWAACKVSSKQELRALFEPRFYFGCEADDPMNAWAFNARANPLGARLRAAFGSDIGHWDVTDMREVLEEAYEPVEHGVITRDDFRDLVFTNPVRLHAGVNPDFFKGTRVESAAAGLLRKGV